MVSALIDGDDGTVRGVPVAGRETSPLPSEFLARTTTLYVVPLVRRLIVSTLDRLTLPVDQRRPPSRLYCQLVTRLPPSLPGESCSESAALPGVTRVIVGASGAPRRGDTDTGLDGWLGPTTLVATTVNA